MVRWCICGAPGSSRPTGRCNTIAAMQNPAVGADSISARGLVNTSSVTACAVPPSPRGRFLRDVEDAVPYESAIFHRSKIVTPQYAAVKGRRIAAALPRLDEQRTRQYLPLPREQKGCSFLRTGVVPRRGQTLCPLLGVFFCFVFLHGQENEGPSGKDIFLHEQKEMAHSWRAGQCPAPTRGMAKTGPLSVGFADSLRLRSQS